MLGSTGSGIDACSGRPIPGLTHARISRPRNRRMLRPTDPEIDAWLSQPTPLVRHVPPTDPATATCSTPADPASATCSPAESGYCDMFDPSRTPLVRHVQPADTASATCSPDRSRYCDMFDSSRPRQSDMFPRQIPLLRHVRLQPTPPERHVLPADPATATCSTPADPARATCSPGRSGYCDMFDPSRPR